MKKIIFTSLFIFVCFFAKSQTFSWTGNSQIADFRTDTIPIIVSGMTAAITNTYGIEKICFDILHQYKSDLEISMVSPDGTTILLVQNTGGAGDNFSGTCMAMNGVPFSNGQPPYTGTFLPVADISSFNNGQNPNGTWLLLIKDIAAPDSGTISFASIKFSNNPPNGQGTGGSNLGPSGPFVCPTCVCPGGAAGCDLLPDVTASYKEINTNHNEVPGALYVANATPNIGYGPIELYAIDSCFCNGVPSPCSVACPNGAQIEHIVRQRIYRKIPGKDTLAFYDRSAGAMTFHPQHGHLHVDNWSNYTLRTATSNPDATTWPIVGTGVKQSFCLVNLGNCSTKPGQCIANNGDTILTVPNHNFGFRTGCGLNQGIYPGNYDVYSLSLNDPIPLVNVCNGNYYIVSITDPYNQFVESDETNNWVAVPITLTKQNATPLISSSAARVFCQGDSIILTSSIAPNYLWSTGATTQSIVVKEAGTYTVSSSCGTSVSTSAPFIASILPAATTAGVSINISSGNNPSCANSLIIFTASPVNGGDNPRYQWKVNGSNSGTNSSTFTTSGLTNGQVVTCVMTSNISCLAATPANSNSITVSVNPVGNPSVAITQTTGSNPQCLGDLAKFKANVSNGNNITYQWKLNNINVGTNSDEFSTTTLTNGQTLQCEIISTAICPSKSILGLSSNINSSTSSQGAAYPTYYGNGRQQYLILASELAALGFTPGNITSLGFNVGATLGNPQTLKNYSIKMAATSATLLTTTFITASLTTVFGPVNYTPVLSTINTHEFTTPFYWNGTSNIVVDICFANQVIGRKAYQTYQSTTAFTSTNFYQADTTTGAAACVRTLGSTTGTLRPNMIFTSSGYKNSSSNVITMSVNSNNPPAVSIAITTGKNPQCAGTNTSFTATPDNTGANPVYKWTKNGIELNGETGNTYTSNTLTNNDTIRCLLTAGLTCGTLSNVISNEVVIKIPEPVYTFTGSGNWNIAANWANNIIPPTMLLPCSEIIINPVANGECILNAQQTITPGAKITVVTGKKFRVPGNLLMQQ